MVYSIPFTPISPNVSDSIQQSYKFRHCSQFGTVEPRRDQLIPAGIPKHIIIRKSAIALKYAFNGLPIIVKPSSQIRCAFKFLPQVIQFVSDFAQCLNH